MFEENQGTCYSKKMNFLLRVVGKEKEKYIKNKNYIFYTCHDDVWKEPFKLLKYCFVILVILTSSVSSEDVASCDKGYFRLSVGIICLGKHEKVIKSSDGELIFGYLQINRVAQAQALPRQLFASNKYRGI